MATAATAATAAIPAAPTPREVHNEPWRLLATLPSTNWKTVSGSVLVWATCAQYFALQWAGRDVRISGGLWDSWLIFVGSVYGIAAAQYAWKRKTYDPSGPEAQRAAAIEPGPAAEAVRERGAAMRVAEVAAASGATVVPVPVVPLPVAPPPPVAARPSPTWETPTATPTTAPTTAPPADAPGARIPGEGD